MSSSIYAVRQFAPMLLKVIDAMCDPIAANWSNGAMKGQINGLKMLKRSIGGFAGIDPLRTRMVSTHAATEHQL
jgi:transposase